MLETDILGFEMRKVQCCYCRKQFTAHGLLNDNKLGCPHCGTEALIMLHTCPDCFHILNGKSPIRNSPQPHKCPVCNGKGIVRGGKTCHPCGGKGIVWYGETT